MAGAPAIASVGWGEAGGAALRLWTLSSGGGLRVSVSNLGGTVQSVWMRDRAGGEVNVALGFATAAEYLANADGSDASASGEVYFGGIIGRYANRIAGGALTLDGRPYALEGNDGPGAAHTLHSASAGWHRRVWSAEEISGERAVGLRLELDDPDGRGGFPGDVHAEVRYTVSARDVLRIDYRASTTAPTVVNLTNHTYWNLAGEGSGDVLGHELQLRARAFTPTDADGIPLGHFAAVDGTPFDFRTAKPLGRDIRRVDLPSGPQLLHAHGYDHHLVLDGRGLRLVARLRDPESGRELLVATSEPGVQLYTANHLAGDLVGTGGRAYRAGDAVALETQHPPDSPHHEGEPGWPSVELRPDAEYRSATALRFRGAGERRS